MKKDHVLDEVGAEDISLELFKISKKLMDLADIATVIVKQPAAIQVLVELGNSTKAAADSFLELA
jgi:hypothetical protein